MAKQRVKFFVILNNETKKVFTAKDQSGKNFIPIFEEDKEKEAKDFMLQHNITDCVAVAYSSYFLIAKFTDYSFVENPTDLPPEYTVEFVTM